MIGLTGSQKEAAEFPLGEHLLVNGGPGTGKTTVLAHRIKYALDQGHSPSDIQALTTTGMAAQLLQSKIHQFGIDTSNSMVDTIHSYCKRAFPKSRNGRILRCLDHQDEAFLYQLACYACGIHSFEERQRVIGRMKISETMGFSFEDSTVERKVQQWVDQLCQAHSLHTYSGLIKHYIGENDVGESQLAAKKKLILIDGLEDITDDQWRLIRMNNCSITATADINQAVFSFAGANLGPFGDFLNNLSGNIVLRKTYNKNPALETLSSGILSLSKTALIPPMVESDLPVLKQFTTKQQEANWTANEVKSLLERGIEPNKISILVRSKVSQDLFIESFDAKGIPWKLSNITGSNIAALLKFLHSRNCFHFLAMIYKLKLATLEDCLKCLDHHDWRGWNIQAAQNTIKIVTEVMDKIDSSPKSISNVAESLKIYMKSGLYLRPLVERKSEEEVLRMISSLAKDSTTSGTSLIDLLFESQDLSYIQDQIGVTVNTVHSCKGFHFDYLFLPQVNDNTYPHFFANDTIQLAEEKRLFYMAVTRCNRILYASFSNSGGFKGHPSFKLSRFVEPVRERFVMKTPAALPATHSAMTASRAKYPLVFQEPKKSIKGNFVFSARRGIVGLRNLVK